MHSPNTYDGMLRVLREAFTSRYARDDVNLVGVLFVRPENRLARHDILPHINYWHFRSGNKTDFFCPGYVQDYSGQSGPEVARVGDERWCFSDMRFTSFLEEFEKMTTWRYRGGCELIITNARYDKRKRKSSLDLRSALAIDLESAIDHKATRSVTELCEAVFQFAGDISTSGDPCWEFSDTLGARVLKGSLKEYLLSFLPKSLSPEAKKLVHFASRDLSVA